MARRSRLHIPQHHSRPGEVPDFSYIETSPAGAVPRPDVNARVRDIGHLSIDLVRVLDDSHVAVGQWNPTSRCRTCRSACATCCSPASSTNACSVRSARARPNRRLAALAAEAGLPLVDLTPALAGLANTDVSFYMRLDDHWNATGHQTAASILASGPLLDELLGSSPRLIGIR